MDFFIIFFIFEFFFFFFLNIEFFRNPILVISYFVVFFFGCLIFGIVLTICRDLVRLLGGAVAGIHSMTDEHFGISVVEFMAAGAIPIGWHLL